MPRITRRKIFWSVIALSIFGVGVLIGSFLVLKSETSEGGLYELSDAGAFTGFASQAESFIEDLRAFQEQSPSTLPEDNLTRGFLDAVVKTGTAQGLSPEEIKSQEFMYETVLPYFQEQSHNIRLIPEVADSEILTSVKRGEAEYLDKSRRYFILIMGVWQKLFTVDPASLESTKTKTEYENVFTLLSLTEKELKKEHVPLRFQEIQRKLIQLTRALQTVTQDVILNRKEDPVRSLILLMQLDAIPTFSQSLVADIDKIAEEIKP